MPMAEPVGIRRDTEIECLCEAVHFFDSFINSHFVASCRTDLRDKIHPTCEIVLQYISALKLGYY